MKKHVEVLEIYIFGIIEPINMSRKYNHMQSLVIHQSEDTPCYHWRNQTATVIHYHLLTSLAKLVNCVGIKCLWIRGQQGVARSSYICICDSYACQFFSCFTISIKDGKLTLVIESNLNKTIRIKIVNATMVIIEYTQQLNIEHILP